MKLRDRLDEIHKEVTEHRAETRVELAEIKRDVAYHIKRTNILEAKVESMEKLYNFLVLTGRLLVIAAAGAAILRLFWDVIS